MKRIKKIKVTKIGRINIEYSQYNDRAETWDEYSLSCADAPKPSFEVALQRLDKYVVELCELPWEYRERIKVTGVTFSYGGEAEVMGAVIVSQMELNDSNCNLNLNTPHKASESYTDQEADPKQLLSDECVEDLFNLCKEVEKYIEGDRAQLNMFAAI